MNRRLFFNAMFSDIGLMPISINTYRTDMRKAISDYVKRMADIGVTVISTSDAHWA